MDEIINQEEEKQGFWSRLKAKFHKGGEEEEEKPVYKRRLLDGRVEKFLDQNFNSYIQEYGIITGLDIESYEQRYSSLTGRISSMQEYMLDAESSIGAMENEMKEIKKATKKGGK